MFKIIPKKQILTQILKLWKKGIYLQKQNANMRLWGLTQFESIPLHQV